MPPLTILLIMFAVVVLATLVMIAVLRGWR